MLWNNIYSRDYYVLAKLGIIYIYIYKDYNEIVFFLHCMSIIKMCEVKFQNFKDFYLN